MVAADRPDVLAAARWPGVDVRVTGAGHRCAGGDVCALLPECARQRIAFLRLSHAVHGRDARHGAVGQPAVADGVLGTHQHQLVPVDRLLVAPQGCARRRAHGLRADGRWRPGPARRHPDDRPHRRQFPAGCRAGGRRSDSRQSAVSVCTGAGAAGHLHQERAVPVPLLVAARDGGADAGVGVPAFGHDGEGRRVPAGAPASCPGRHRPVLLHGHQHRCDHAVARRMARDLPARSRRACWRTRPSRIWALSRCCSACPRRWRW